MTEKPLVSVILTLYEIKKEYLNECIKSILNQTYDNVEIIAINDCSPKTNYDYLTNISPKIKLYKNEVNMGLTKTVNKAFTLVNGKYVVRMGSDDFFDPTLFEKEVKILEQNNTVGAVCCELQRFGRKDQYIARPQSWDLKNILAGCVDGVGYAGGMMFRSELLKEIKIDESFRVCEDFDFHLQILEKTSIKSIHEILYFYRSHDTNIMKSIKAKERRKIMKEILEKHKAKNKKPIKQIKNYF